MTHFGSAFGEMTLDDLVNNQRAFFDAHYTAISIKVVGVIGDWRLLIGDCTTEWRHGQSSKCLFSTNFAVLWS